MLYEKGSCADFTSLTGILIDFLQKPEGEVLGWELISNNYNDFRGTTFRVKGIDDDCYLYVSLRVQEVILGQTYKNWYNTFKMSEDYQHSDAENVLTSKNGQIDIFSEDGWFLGFNVHKQYTEDFWMCEQGGSYLPNNADLNILPFRNDKYKNGVYIGTTFFNPPTFPDIGKPILSATKIDLMVSPIEYWFTRTKNCATVTLKIRECYQSISFGFFDGVNKATYKFPAFIAGGTTGFTNEGWIFHLPNASYPTYRMGTQINLNVKNTCLSNSNLLNSTKFDTGVSNVLVMTPSGEWEHHYNFKQTMSVSPYHTCGSPSYNWGFYLNKPVKVTGENNTIFPSESDYRNVTDYYDAIEPDNTNYIVSPLVMPVAFLRNNGNMKGIVGFVPNCFAIFSKQLLNGINTINGKKYLVIPNGWEERLLYYPAHIGVYAEHGNEFLLKYWEDLKIDKFAKLAIKLEE